MSSGDERRLYYERRFADSGGADWDEAPGKEVILAGLRNDLASDALRRNEALIDVGCGTGFLLERVRTEICEDWRLVGIDFASSAIEIGRARFESLDLHQGDASAMPFRDASFDIAVSYGSLEHVVTPEVGVAETARVLRPGGRFYFMIPTLGVYRTDRDDEGWYEDLTGQPQWNLHRATWEMMLAGAGLVLDPDQTALDAGALRPGVFYIGTKR